MLFIGYKWRFFFISVYFWTFERIAANEIPSVFSPWNIMELPKFGLVLYIYEINPFLINFPTPKIQLYCQIHDKCNQTFSSPKNSGLKIYRSKRYVEKFHWTISKDQKQRAESFLPSLLSFTRSDVVLWDIFSMHARINVQPLKSNNLTKYTINVIKHFPT